MYVSVRIHRFAALAIAAVLLLGLVTAVWGSAAAPAGAVPDDPVAVPIIMYHGLLKDSKLQGKYILSPTVFEEDLKYLKEHGYNTIVVQDLLDYVYRGVPLPEKPIMITFDDGYLNNYVYAFPLLQKYNMKMVLSPVGRYCDQYTESPDTNASYAQVTWAHLKEMMDSGLVEVQNHSYNLHSNSQSRNGAKKNKGESLEEYQTTLRNDLGEMQRKMKEYTGFEPTAFTYPFGAISEASLEVVKELGFQASFSCEEKVNYVTRDPECLYLLGRYLRAGGVGTESFFERVLKKAES